MDRVDPWGCATGTYGNSGGFWYSNCAQANINGDPSLFSANGPEGFLWNDLPFGTARDVRKLLVSRMWLLSL